MGLLTHMSSSMSSWQYQLDLFLTFSLSDLFLTLILINIESVLVRLLVLRFTITQPNRMILDLDRASWNGWRKYFNGFNW